MTAIRKLLKGRSGFTLVELMVVVVVLGILAGIAVQRMGDVRDRAEEAAQDANARLLLGSANLAKTQNYAGAESGDFNYVIRWRRHDEGQAVADWYGEHDTNPDTFDWTLDTDFDGDTAPETGTGYTNVPAGDWFLTSYLESFPVEYAVEIVYGEDSGFDSDIGFEDGDYDIDEIRVFRYTGGYVDEDNLGNWERIFPEFD